MGVSQYDKTFGMEHTVSSALPGLEESAARSQNLHNHRTHSSTKRCRADWNLGSIGNFDDWRSLRRRTRTFAVGSRADPLLFCRHHEKENVPGRGDVLP